MKLEVLAVVFSLGSGVDFFHGIGEICEPDSALFYVDF